MKKIKTPIERPQLSTLLLISLVLSGLIFFPVLEAVVDNVTITKRHVVFSVLISICVTGFVLFMTDFLLTYLIGGKTPTEINELRQSVAKTASKMLAEMGSLSNSTPGIGSRPENLEEQPLRLENLTDEEREIFLSNIKTQTQEVLVSALLSELEKKYSTQIAHTAQINEVRRKFVTTEIRLQNEINALGRKANLSLVIGIMTTAIAVILLTYLVLGASATELTTLPAILSHFIPRVSVAFFIEVFSFFFLKLYKSGLQEIKYFQNELTNIEMKGVALESALINLTSQPANPIIDHLMRTDRNLALPQSATTDGATQINPKDLIDLVEKLGKLLNAKS